MAKGKPKSKLSPLLRAAVSDKIRYLMKKEGKPHKEAVAIALSMARQGKDKK